jgi:hypothetical protein
VLIIAAVYFAFLGQRKEPEVSVQSEEMMLFVASEKDHVVVRS